MTQKTRIAPVPPKQANLLTRVMYRIARRRFGEVPEPFTVAAHHPRLLVANAVHETLLQSGSKKLPASVRELAVFWTARTDRLLVVRRLRLDAAAPRRPRRRPAQGHRQLRDVAALHRRRARRDRATPMP